jgi:predicted nucleotidyltransferase
LGALAAALPVCRVVLFGSYALGRHTVASDIDLLVVYDDPPRPDAYALTRRALDLRRLEPHVYTLSEYQALKPVVDRMTDAGIVLLAGAGGPIAT